tara:strand:- start:138 stop:761 length:624 start_codon:yes stop_codon:yes gene_type:complete
MQQNLDSQLNQIREVGYCVIEAALQADVINAVKHALLPWFGRQRMGRNNFEGEQTERVYALLDKDPVFALIVEHEAVLAIVNKLLEPTYLLSANLAINIHPTETPQPFHADHASVPNCPRNALNGVSTIWAMDDFTQANGATQVVPGSHLWRTQKPIKDEMLQDGCYVSRFGFSLSWFLNTSWWRQPVNCDSACDHPPILSALASTA